MHSDHLLIESLFGHYAETKNSRLVAIVPISHGHINRSYKVQTDNTSYFVQQINHKVFPEVRKLSNQLNQIAIQLESYYCKHHLPYETLAFYQTLEQEKFVELNHNSYWRIADYKSELISHQSAIHVDMVNSAATAFAHFSKGLSELSIEKAFEPIHRFHDISYRYVQLKDAGNKTGEYSTVITELLMIADEVFSILRPVHEALSTRDLPKRWTHNDTKLNNLLFDNTGNARCVIDLDTVMPGSVLFDVGDAIRTICTNLPEDDPSVESLEVQFDYAEVFIKAYSQVYADSLTLREQDLLPYSGMYMAAIMGYRFLADYLNGNVYYHTSYPEQNLHRATNQLFLAKALSKLL